VNLKSYVSAYLLNGHMNIGLFFFQNPLVVNTINAVLAISHALGTVRRELCPGKLHCFHIYIYIYIYVSVLDGFCSVDV